MTWKLQEGFSYVIRAELANTEFNNCEGGDLIGKVNQVRLYSPYSELHVTHFSKKNSSKTSLQYKMLYKHYFAIQSLFYL